MTERDTADTMVIAGLGSFRVERIAMPVDGENDFEEILFTKTHLLHAQTIELIVYADEEGVWPSLSQRAELVTRFKKFEGGLDSALEQLPSQLKTLCVRYGENIDNLTSSQIIDGIRWDNVKLEPDGCIECYTSIPSVSVNFDVVMRFSPSTVLTEVYFDG